MKHILGLVIGILVLLIAGQVWAQTQTRSHSLYLSGNFGFGIRPDAKATGLSGEFDNDPALTLNGALGIELLEHFRLEAEAGLHINSADRTTSAFPDYGFSMVSLMANAFFDIPTGLPLKPYVGAGAGFGIAGASEDFFDSSDSDLVGAFQLMAGLGYDISPKATLTIGYRYFNSSDPDFVLAPFGFFETEYTSHDILFGARFRF
jgi:opacity protein-like surface antigen